MKIFKVDKCDPLHFSKDGRGGCPFAADDAGSLPVICTYHGIVAFIAVEFDDKRPIPERCPLEELL